MDKGYYKKSGDSATISCFDCGEVCHINDHTILVDGVVHPSLVCPNENCTFHSYVKLENWK